MVRVALIRVAAAETERLYVAVLLALGVLFAIVLPPFQAPDEIVHFVRAYGISQGQCVAHPTIRIPQSYEREATTFGALNAADPEVSQGRLRGDVLRSLRRRGSSETTDIRSKFLIYVYPCVLYVPAALVLGLTAGAHPGIVAALLLARLATFLACAALLVAGYRLLPFGKALYIFVSLLPMFVAQSASVSGDSLTNALAMFAVAQVMRMSYGEDHERLSVRTFSGLAGLAICLSLAKLDVVLLLLLLLIPAPRFGGVAQKYIGLTGVAALGLGVNLAWSAVNHELAQTIVANQVFERGVDVAYNLRYLVNRPADAAIILWNSAHMHLTDWLRSTAGIFGWLVTALPPWSVGGAVALFLYFSVRVPSQGRLGGRARALLAVASFTGMLLVVVLVFGYELTRAQIAQAPASVALGGVQGRYFLPFLLPLGLVAGLARDHEEGGDITLAVCAAIVLNVLGLVTIAQYFYR